MAKLTTEQALMKAKAHLRKGDTDTARHLYRTILQTFPQNKRARQALAKLDQGEKGAGEKTASHRRLSQDVLDRLIGRFNSGDLKGVAAEAERLSSDFPTTALLSNILGAANRGVGRLDKAEKSFARAAAVNPSYPDAFNNLGNVLKEQGRLSDAMASVSRAIQLRAEYAEAHNNMGDILKGLGRSEEAIDSFRRAIRLRSSFSDAHNNLGIALNDLDRPEEAAGSFLHATRLTPDFAHAHNNLGVTYRKLGRLEDAVESFTNALRIAPDFTAAHNNLGNAFRDLGRLDEAVAAFGQAIRIRSDYAEAHNNLGSALLEQGRLDDAVASFSMAIQLKNDLVDAHANLIEAFEISNRLDDAGLAIDRMEQIFPDIPDSLKLRRAIHSFRSGDASTAVTELSTIDGDRLVPKLRTKHLEFLARALEASGDYQAAFAQTEALNRLILETHVKFRQPADAYLRQIQARCGDLNSAGPPLPRTAAPRPATSPVFMVGFPRSGTTLLDTFLRGHPRVDIVEEMPMLDKAIEHIGEFKNLHELEKLPLETREHMLNLYNDELDQHVRSGPEDLVIDKLPMNIVRMPEINALFPGARIILSVRHPLDCILSCYKQNFKMNRPMYLMLSLKTAAELYDAAMSIFHSCQERYSLDVHVLRYEDLVANPEKVLRPAIDFIGLDWNDAILDHQTTARTRVRIGTPSYSQVSERLYQRSTYLWRKYEKHVGHISPKVRRWTETFGYTD